MVLKWCYGTLFRKTHCVLSQGGCDVRGGEQETHRGETACLSGLIKEGRLSFKLSTSGIKRDEL